MPCKDQGSSAEMGTRSKSQNDYLISVMKCQHTHLHTYTPTHLPVLQEARRAGDHAVGAEALQILEWELAGAAFDTISSLLGCSTEQGVQGVDPRGRYRVIRVMCFLLIIMPTTFCVTTQQQVLVPTCHQI